MPARLKFLHRAGPTPQIRKGKAHLVPRLCTGKSQAPLLSLTLAAFSKCCGVGPCFVPDGAETLSQGRVDRLNQSRLGLVEVLSHDLESFLIVREAKRTQPFACAEVVDEVRAVLRRLRGGESVMPGAALGQILRGESSENTRRAKETVQLAFLLRGDRNNSKRTTRQGPGGSVEASSWNADKVASGCRAGGRTCTRLFCWLAHAVERKTQAVTAETAAESSRTVAARSATSTERRASPPPAT